MIILPPSPLIPTTVQISPIQKQNLMLSLDPYLTEFQIFRVLYKLQPTAMGLNGLPAWFLRFGAPAFYKPIAKLCQPLPIQWKQTSILPSANTKIYHLQASFRLDHTSLNSNNGADSRTTLPLYSLLVTTPYIDIL